MTESTKAVFRVADGVHVRTFDNELVILDLAGGNYFGLDAIGARIWLGLLDGRSVLDVSEQIAAEFSVPLEIVQRDLEALVCEFEKRRLLLRTG